MILELVLQTKHGNRQSSFVCRIYKCCLMPKYNKENNSLVQTLPRLPADMAWPCYQIFDVILFFSFWEIMEVTT